MWVIPVIALVVISVALAEKRTRPVPTTINPQGKQVLIFGDSLSVGKNSPGGQLAKRLVDAGASHVRVNAKVSRSAWNFFRKEPGFTILRGEQKHRPDIVILFLGTNAIGINLEKEATRLEHVAGFFPNAEIWAIGPPSQPEPEQKIQAVVNMMSGLFAPRFIDLRSYTGPTGRSPDGVHFTSFGAKRLANMLDEEYIR